jgi:hypothetical protein
MKRIFAALMALTLCGCTCTLAGCSNSDQVRYQLKAESENNYGVMRTVTAYSSTGKQIGQWHGKIDVQYTYSTSDVQNAERIDVVIFDGDKPVDRIVISGAIVVVDND